MALQVQKMTSFSRFQQDSASLHRPMMLKDFLRDDSSHSCTPPRTTVVISLKSNIPPVVLLRNWSKKAAATKISALNKVIKLLQFATMKSPSVLPRSFSRKSATYRRKDKNDIFGNVPEVKVKIKDILRWRSFRDMAEENSTPSDFPSSPNQSRSTTTTTSSCSKRSSWCDSDFTAEELPPWGGENAAILRNPAKGDCLFEESEQQSPVSVLEYSPFRQAGEFKNPRMTNVQQRIHEFAGPKRNLPRTFQGLESFEGVKAAEQKSKLLLSHVDRKSQVNDQLILNFFMHELSINGELMHEDEFNRKLLRLAESWIDGEVNEPYEWEMEDKREAYVKDLEKGTCWSKFKQEQEDVSKELEIEVLNDLVDHLLNELLDE